MGVVGVLDELVIAARQLQKADDRPGGFIATGGHGGIVATMGKPGPAVLTFRPAHRHTSSSEVAVGRLPESVRGYRRSESGAIEPVEVIVRDGAGDLSPTAIPRVTIVKHARYDEETTDPSSQVEILERMKLNLGTRPLAGFVAEGGTPYGHIGQARDTALQRAALLGMPTVKVARGNADGFVPSERMSLAIAGGNLTATKARLLLMACLMRFGALPAVADPDAPTSAELGAVHAQLARYQEVFDTH